MKDKRTIGAFIALFAVLLGCFYMPDYVAGITDRSTLGKQAVLDAKSISFEAGPDLALSARLRLIASSGHESIRLKNGKLSESQARSLVTRELRRFFGTSGMIEGLLSLTIDECAPMFVIDAEDPSINMIVWRAHLSSPGGQTVTITVDEETEAILKINYRGTALGAVILRPEGSSGYLVGDAKQLDELICNYYKLPTVLKHELIGELLYYNVEPEFDGTPVALYGIVSSAGFSVNEQRSAIA